MNSYVVPIAAICYEIAIHQSNHMLDKIFSWSKKKQRKNQSPEYHFGRYSDNNKPVDKVEQLERCG